MVNVKCYEKILCYTVFESFVEDTGRAESFEVRWTKGPFVTLGHSGP